MIVLVLSKVPPGLRGHLTRWLLEVSPGVFVGKVSARVRDELWSLTTSELRDGTAIMILPARNEQGFEIRNSGHRWTPVDLDGFVTLRRPPANDTSSPAVKAPLPKASRYRWLRSRRNPS
ncbi:type I-E CRISPR-associated endoribonuclease Cas2 [Arachnia propionica]|uniref:Type I-E CRISPR-associated endoribonuclease Cas2 n=1 Tax=Arachnia propionica TaxID=1750 RepID=A0A3P1T572_9ACTN|nr:type I-E CRISPR-associated endoribonuclease Cas2 [Arachnia propionica]